MLELFARKVSKMFVYKYTETIDTLKSMLLFEKNTSFTDE